MWRTCASIISVGAASGDERWERDRTMNMHSGHWPGVSGFEGSCYHDTMPIFDSATAKWTEFCSL